MEPDKAVLDYINEMTREQLASTIRKMEINIYITDHTAELREIVRNAYVAGLLQPEQIMDRS